MQNIVAPGSRQIEKSFEHDKLTGNINILAVGIDDVQGSHRSDTIAVVAINIEDRFVKVLSLPRDLRVQIEGRGWQKLNHAYAYGGIDLLRSTINNFLGIPLHYHVIVNYQSFPKLVDLLGGVTIDVPKRLRYTDRAGGLHIDIPAGRQLLDGKTALEFVRFRHDALGDIGRIQRQQLFLREILNKIRQPETLAALPEIVEQATRFFQTEIQATQAIQLVNYLKDLEGSRFSFETMPGKAAMIDGISYWLGDTALASQFLTTPPEPVSGDKAEAPKEPLVTADSMLAGIKGQVAILNGCGVKGISQALSEHLQRLGIDVAFVGNAKHFDYRYTNIAYPENTDTQTLSNAKALGELCGIPENLVRVNRGATHATIIVGKDYDIILNRLKKYKRDL
jgi:LCP family protein required for cell wall assembly